LRDRKALMRFSAMAALTTFWTYCRETQNKVYVKMGTNMGWKGWASMQDQHGIWQDYTQY
jgi:hypothetical protein